MMMSCASDLAFLHSCGRYRMDYMAFVEYHQASQADITIGCLPCNDERAQDFGLMKIDDAGQVIVRLAFSCQTHAALKQLSSCTCFCHYSTHRSI